VDKSVGQTRKNSIPHDRHQLLLFFNGTIVCHVNFESLQSHNTHCCFGGLPSICHEAEREARNLRPMYLDAQDSDSEEDHAVAPRPGMLPVVACNCPAALMLLLLLLLSLGDASDLQAQFTRRHDDYHLHGLSQLVTACHSLSVWIDAVQGGQQIGHSFRTMKRCEIEAGVAAAAAATPAVLKPMRPSFPA
jgi:hypothetical protein